jgi:hypothetical protein
LNTGSSWSVSLSDSTANLFGEQNVDEVDGPDVSGARSGPRFRFGPGVFRVSCWAGGEVVIESSMAAGSRLGTTERRSMYS